MLKKIISSGSIIFSAFLCGLLMSACTVEKNHEFRFDISGYTDRIFARNTVTLPVLATPVPSRTLTATATEFYTATIIETLTATPTLKPVYTPTFASVDISTLSTSAVDSIGSIEDINFPDGSIFTPGEVFVKCWKLQNNGGEIWKQGMRLAISLDGVLDTPQVTNAIFLKDAELIDFSISTWGTRIFNTAPGEMVFLAVPLQAPMEPGEYQIDFHLIDNKNEMIPVRFWAHFYVEDIVSDAELTETASPSTSTPTPKGPVEPTATLTVDQRRYEWSGIWTIRDPYQESGMQPVTAWMQQDGSRLTGFFYDSENEPVLIQGSLQQDGRVFNGEFARPWLNRATPVIWRMPANKDQFYSVTEGGLVGQGSSCGGRNGASFPESCSLPSDG